MLPPMLNPDPHAPFVRRWLRSRARLFAGLTALVLCIARPVAVAAEVGEFSIPAVNPLNAAQLKALRELAEEDPEAGAIVEETKQLALPLINARPTPLEVIHYEGLVNTDPRRIATVAKLKQMSDIARLVRWWQATGDERAASTLRRFIVAWTDTYELTGNDVNENKFRPLLVSYHALRESFEPEERDRIDAWVERLGELHAEAVRTSGHFTNRYGKHIRLTALAGMILDRREWVDLAHEGVKRFVTESLRPDGSSHDFEYRDTLTYHTSALRPPIELAMIAGDQGRELYAWESPEGGSLKKSVDFVVPYAMGEKTHKEWVNSKVDLDRRRAEAGLEKYQPGRLFDPKDALRVMEEASFFDPSLMKVVHHLHDGDAGRFPTWQTLVNAAAHRAAMRGGTQ